MLYSSKAEQSWVSGLTTEPLRPLPQWRQRGQRAYGLR